MLPNLGWPELLMIMVFALVVFGPKRLPDIARQIGKAIREVRKVSGQFQDEIRTGLALDDQNFPYMKPPQTPESQTSEPAQPGAPQPAPEPGPPQPAPEPGAVRYGEVRPPAAEAPPQQQT